MPEHDISFVPGHFTLVGAGFVQNPKPSKPVREYRTLMSRS